MMEKSKKEIVQEKFPIVLELLTQGVNIREALKSVKVPKNLFYSNITAEQRLEIHTVKTLRTKYGVGTHDHPSVVAFDPFQDPVVEL